MNTLAPVTKPPFKNARDHLKCTTCIEVNARQIEASTGKIFVTLEMHLLKIQGSGFKKAYSGKL